MPATGFSQRTSKFQRINMYRPHAFHNASNSRGRTTRSAPQESLGGKGDSQKIGIECNDTFARVRDKLILRFVLTSSLLLGCALVIYVDVILVMSKTKQDYERFRNLLESEFNLKVLGKFKQIVGIRCEACERWDELYQNIEQLQIDSLFTKKTKSTSTFVFIRLQSHKIKNLMFVCTANSLEVWCSLLPG